MKLNALKIALLSLVFVTTFSHSSVNLTEDNNTGGHLSFALPVQINKLDPIGTMNAHTKSIISLIYETLITINAKQELEPGLAKSWYVENEGKSITIEINPNHRFADNSVVTASDVIKSFDRLCGQQSKARGEVRGLQGCPAYSETPYTKPRIFKLSEYKVQFNITSNPTTFLYQLSSPRTAIVKQIKNGQLIGSGAYYVKLQNNEKLILSKNPYSNTNKNIRNNGIIFFSAGGRDLESALARNITGALMYRQESLANVSYGDYKYIKSNPNITEILVLNNKKFPFNHRRIRIALSMEIQNNFLHKCASGAHQAYGIIPFGIGGSINNSIPSKPHNLTKDEAFEVSSILNRKKIDLNIHLMSDIKNQCLLNEISNAAKKYNIEFHYKIHTNYQSLIRSYHDHSIDAFIDLFVFKNRDAYPIFEYFSKEGENFANISDDQIDKILNEAISTISSHSRLKMYRKLNQYIQDNGIVIPLFYMDHGNLLNKCLTGIDHEFLINPFYELTKLSRSKDCLN